jgi:hypothetical protein
LFLRKHPINESEEEEEEEEEEEISFEQLQQQFRPALFRQESRIFELTAAGANLKGGGNL